MSNDSSVKLNYINYLDLNSNYEDLKFEEIFSSKGRSRIIKLLALRNELNITHIVQKTGLNHSYVKKTLEFLKKIGFVREKVFGRIKIYQFKNDNENAKAVKNLIEFWESSNNVDHFHVKHNGI